MNARILIGKALLSGAAYYCFQHYIWILVFCLDCAFSLFFCLFFLFSNLLALLSASPRGPHSLLFPVVNRFSRVTLFLPPFFPDCSSIFRRSLSSVLPLSFVPV